MTGRQAETGYIAGDSFIDRFCRAVGSVASWLAAAIVLLQFAVVLLRYLFDWGSIPMQEAVLYMFGIMFMLGASASLAENGHVRVDIFFNAQSPQRQALIDLLGTVFLLVPFCAVSLYLSVPYAAASWKVLEGSREISGLPGVFLVKTVIPLAILLLLMQALIIGGRAAAVLKSRAEHG